MITCFSVSKSSVAKTGPQDIGQQVETPLLAFGQHGGVVDRVLFAGEGVVMRPHLVELAVDVVGRPRWRPLEDHVLEEMAHAGQRVALVARAGLDEETEAQGIGLRVAFGHDFQAVVERLFQELQASLLSGEATLLPPTLPSAGIFNSLAQA